MSRERAISFLRFERLSSKDTASSAQAGETYAAPLCLFLLALTLARVAANAFSNTDLFFDEAQYWFWSRELAFGYYSKPPLIGWIIRGATEICGQSEACIRSPSALFHAGTALLIYGIGRQLYHARIGFWAGLTYASLPGVSLSSTLISTDVPLLFFIALALFALLKLHESGAWLWACLFGLALGLGFLSKYAMAYFLLCLGLALIWLPLYRPLLQTGKFYVALAIGAAILAPNLLWNAQNGFATFSHTADNANWSGFVVHPIDALEFLGGQFGVFGPILFAALLVFCWNWLFSSQIRNQNGKAERLLLAFSIPVIALMTMQAFLSRAHANWAAFAYIAATVLVVAVLIRDGWHRLFRVSLAVHMAIFLLISAGGILAGRIALPGGADPYVRILGWEALAQSAAAKARAGEFRTIATDKRAVAAELFYYLRDEDITIVTLRGNGPPKDHFELTRPLTDETPGPVLLVSLGRKAPPGSSALGSSEIPAGPVKTRRVFFYALGGPDR